MIPGGREGVGQLSKNTLGIVPNRTRLAVKQFRRTYDLAPESGADRLMPKANSQDREFSCELLHQFNANACVLRSAGTGRDHNAFGFAARNFIDGNLVVAVNF